MPTLPRRPLVGLLVDRQAVLAPNRGWSCLLLRRWGDLVGCFEAVGEEEDRGD